MESGTRAVPWHCCPHVTEEELCPQRGRGPEPGPTPRPARPPSPCPSPARPVDVAPGPVRGWGAHIHFDKDPQAIWVLGRMLRGQRARQAKERGRTCLRI